MVQLDAEVKEALLNGFALRSLRDVADGDYIAARLAYRADLQLQGFWASQQALEKYLKAILLFRRIPNVRRGHSLRNLLAALEREFPLRLSRETLDFITF